MSIQSDAARDRVLVTAATWLGTPFHDMAGVRGSGVDCAHFIARVFEEAGIVPHVDIEPYSPQWFLHRSEEKFIGYIERAGAREIEEEEARRADIVMYKIGRCYAHGAIIVAWPLRVIHAHKPSGCVTYGEGVGGDLVDAPRRFFSVWTD